MNDSSLVGEPAHDELLVDDKDRVWFFDPDLDRWSCPEDGVYANWHGLHAYAQGLRLLTAEECVEVEREMFS